MFLHVTVELKVATEVKLPHDHRILSVAFNWVGRGCLEWWEMHRLFSPKILGLTLLCHLLDVNKLKLLCFLICQTGISKASQEGWIWRLEIK